MKIEYWQKHWDLAVLGILMVLAAAYYGRRVNYEFVDSTGDNYTYEILAQSVFTRRPFMINIKFDFFDDLPILHQEREFPPLYPITLAIVHLFLGKSIYVNIFFTCFLGIICAFPAFYLGKLLSNSLGGLLVATLTLFNPTMVEMSITAMSEPLFTLLSLSSLYYLLVYEKEEKKSYLVTAGIFAGLSYLTRTNGMMVIAAGIIYFLFKKRTNRLSFFKETFLYLGMALIISLPWLIRNYLIFGDPFYYVGRFFAGLPLRGYYSAVYKVPPTLGNFLKEASWREIVMRYKIGITELVKIIWRESSTISILALGTIFYFERKPQITAIWLYILLNFLIAIFHPTACSRHIISLFPALYLLATIWIFDSLEKQSWLPLARILVVVVFLWGVGSNIYNGLSFTKTNVEFFSSKYGAAGNWIRKNSPPEAVVMSNKTSSVAYYARRPMIMLPLMTDAATFDKYIKKYKVSYIVSVGYGGYIPKNFVKIASAYEKYINKFYLSLDIYKRTISYP